MTKAEIAKQKLCIEILQNSRNELYHYFPYLDGAFASVGYGCIEKPEGILTDGDFLKHSAIF